tara:strand:- start:588 stop:926 length:339 start_codon:yes stop_codon:yes gene_type:complete
MTKDTTSIVVTLYFVSLVISQRFMDYPNNVPEFVDYVDSFYGTNDPLYPLIEQSTQEPLHKVDILRAALDYIDRCMKGDLEYAHYSWGDGDSLDRERVRDILLQDYDYVHAN